MFERTFSGALGPNFSQIKEIAAGGNGRVLSGIDTRFAFPVCIKRISVANKDECRAALREIRIRRRLRHENIVGLLNVIVNDGTEVSQITPANFRETNCVYLIQELLDADLRQVIESYPRLPDDYVKLFFYQLLRGVKYIHSANVLHRDLKPSNVMININSLQLMIGDFGHSMVLDPEYSHGSSVTVSNTSLWYKAPELILGTGQYSTASDIWAAGCILAEMLLGRPLFEGETDLEQLELIIHAIEVPPKDQTKIRTFLTDEVNTMYSGKPKFPLQLKFQKVDFHALHLLERLLSFNPEDRVTAELALSHPFVQEYSCVADEPVCLKQLHLEHEVDDFLEYTLKDLIVGECVALAEEQPRIHLQMSSCCSLTDITKECNVSPSESTSHSTEDKSLELKTVSEDYHEESNESEDSRFKVLEVLKEEHGSSGSDTNGVASHEEGVSEKPLVLDHPMFGSSKFEKDRHSHKSGGHRRHHHHRRKKKFHMKSPSLETEPTFDSSGCIPEVDGHTCMSRNHVPRLNSPEEESCLSPKVGTHTCESTQLVPPVPSSESSAALQSQDDKVQELIMRSRQLIADQTAVMNGVPAITDICSTVTTNSCLTDVCGSVPSTSPMTGGSDSLCGTVSSNYVPFDVRGTVPLEVHPMETEEEKPSARIDSKFSFSLGDLSRMSHHMPCVDLGVAEVIRRSQELLGEVYRPNTSEEKHSAVRESDRVDDLIKRSEQLLESQEIKEEFVDSVIERSNDLTGHTTHPLEDKNSLTASGTDPVMDLISRSRKLLVSNQNTEQCDSQGDVQVNLEHCRPVPNLNDKSYNYPPPFTDNALNPLTVMQLPAVNNVLSPVIHSGAKPILNNVYHLNGLRTDGVMCSGGEPDMKFEEQSERNSSHGKDEELSVKKPSEKENFDQGLNGIDLNEIKFVLSQAKKLLEKSNELNEEVEQTDMDIDENVKGAEGNCTNMDIDESDPRSDVAIKDNLHGLDKESVTPEMYPCRKEVLKDISSFQNRVDLVFPVSESADIGQSAVMFEIVKVRLSPPLEMQTSRYKCLTRSRVSTESKDSERINHDQFRTSSEFKHALVKKRSSETLSETNEDNIHKHFKNSSVTLNDVNLSTAVSDPLLNKGNCVVENSKQCYGDDNVKPRLNGISFDLNVDTRLIADSNFKADTKNQVGKEYKPDKSSPKYETASLQNRNGYSNGVIEHLNSHEVVDRLCGSTCRKNTARLNAKDSARLHSFYATLKIKSIMRNRTRPQKRHDSYPF